MPPSHIHVVVAKQVAKTVYQERGQRSGNYTAGRTCRCACWTSTKARDPFGGHTGGSWKNGDAGLSAPQTSSERTEESKKCSVCAFHFSDRPSQERQIHCHKALCAMWVDEHPCPVPETGRMKGRGIPRAHPLPSGKKWSQKKPEVQQERNFLSYNQKNARTRSNGVMLHGPASELWVCCTAPSWGYPSLTANGLACDSDTRVKLAWMQEMRTIWNSHSFTGPAPQIQGLRKMVTRGGFSQNLRCLWKSGAK